MKTKFVGLLAGALIAVSAFGAGSASAATEFGDSCTANEALNEAVTLFGVSAPGNSLPTAAPTAGVITKWKSSLVPVPFTIPQTLKLLRQTGGSTVQIIAESSQSIAGGSNSFDVRIPVQPGDRLGLFGASAFGTLICETAEETVIGGFLGGGGGVGSNNAFEQVPSELRIPVSAIIEADGDGDGYGDETQDRCPQNAAVQAACPVVALSTSSIAKRGLANVLVTASAQAAVTVTGSVKTGKGKGNVVTLSGGSQVVLPGVISKFTLLFTQKLKAKLKQLSPKQSLTLNVTATAPNVVGAPSTSNVKVKLKGQKKPKRLNGPKGKQKG